MGQAAGKLPEMKGKDPSIEETKKLSDYPDHENFKGPVEKRRCTDPLFVLAIIAVWVIMTGIGIDSVENGKPYVLWAPMDAQGQFCGYSENVTDTPYLYFIDTHLRGKCVEECPPEFVSPTALSDLICLDGYTLSGFNSYSDFTYLVNGRGICNFKFASTPVFKRCIFTNETLADQYDTSALTDEMEDWASDVIEARAYIFGLGFCLALIIGFVFTTLLRVPLVLPFLVWGSIILIGVAFLGTAAYMLTTAQDWEDASPQEKSDTEIGFLKFLGYLFVILLVIYICVMIFLRKRIKLAMQIIKEATKALQSMPLIVFFPVIQLVGFILFMIAWAYYVVYTAGMATVTVTESSDGYYTRSLSYDDELERRAFVLIFIFYWTSEFIIALGQIVLAMCFAKWYFTRDSKPGSATIIPSLGQGLLYHTGTAAFGSLIIAIIKTIRTILAYMQKKAHKMTRGNKVVDCVLCCIQCCLACFEKCIKFLNKNAYIQTAIFSYSFCAAAKQAFFLIARNIARVGALGLLTEILMFIGKLFISCFTTFLTYCAITSAIGDDLHSVVAPTIMVFVVAYITACIFLLVFHMAIDTIFQCFCVDEELFPGNHFASSDLEKCIDGIQKEAKALKKKNAQTQQNDEGPTDATAI